MKPRSDSTQPLMQDITSANSELITAEIEHGIPVKQQNEPAPAQPSPQGSSAPAAKQFVEQGSKNNDVELENILKDVNKNVAEAAEKDNKKSKFSMKNKLSSKKAETKLVKHSPKLFMISFAALLVAVGLGIAAFYAFKQEDQKPVNKAVATDGKVGTSAASSSAVQAAGGTLVRPGDLTDMSSSLSSKLNNLNDAQDFNSTDLSDKNLGL